MYPDEPAGKRLVRKDHMLWYGKYHIIAELPEYMRGYGNRAKYRYTASICQLWTYVTDQSLYRNGMVLNVGLQSSAYNKEIRRKAIDQKEDYF